MRAAAAAMLSGVPAVGGGKTTGGGKAIGEADRASFTASYAKSECGFPVSSKSPKLQLELSGMLTSGTVAGVAFSFSTFEDGFSSPSRGVGGALRDRANPKPLKFSPFNAGRAIGLIRGVAVSDLDGSLPGASADAEESRLPLSSGAEPFRLSEGTSLNSF